MRRWVIIGGAVVVVQTALLALWWARREVGPLPGKPADGPAPALTIRHLDGTPDAVANARGKPLLLHIWATWCPPCRAELPALLAQPDLPVLAISVDEDPETVRAFAGDHPALRLGESAEVAEALGVRDLPVTFVVDADGRLRRRLDSARDWTVPALRAACLRAAGE
ncbi:MAG: TlpA disulfide reductase family protein [bacterium]